MSVDLARYANREYDPGAGIIKRMLWYAVNALVFDSWLMPFSHVKCAILRLFGASVGIGVIIKPKVNIKYPWFLSIENHTWIGEGVWIDNLAWVRVGANVCISQEAYLLTGNHDYKDPNFGLVTGEIILEDGVWVGARSVVCPGVRMGRESVLTVASVLSKEALSCGIYRGNPAEWIRERILLDRLDE